MKAETKRRPLLPACARALRMKWTLQCCQVAVKILETAALTPPVGVGDDELHTPKTTFWVPGKRSMTLIEGTRPCLRISRSPVRQQGFHPG
jgi:hypothetical protein